MIQQPILSLTARMIPESFLDIYLIYRLMNSKWGIKKILVSSGCAGVFVTVQQLLLVGGEFINCGSRNYCEKWEKINKRGRYSTPFIKYVFSLQAKNNEAS